MTSFCVEAHSLQCTSAFDVGLLEIAVSPSFFFASNVRRGGGHRCPGDHRDQRYFQKLFSSGSIDTSETGFSFSARGFEKIKKTIFDACKKCDTFDKSDTSKNSFFKFCGRKRKTVFDASILAKNWFLTYRWFRRSPDRQ